MTSIPRPKPWETKAYDIDSGSEFPTVIPREGTGNSNNNNNTANININDGTHRGDDNDNDNDNENTPLSLPERPSSLMTNVNGNNNPNHNSGYNNNMYDGGMTNNNNMNLMNSTSYLPYGYGNSSFNNSYGYGAGTSGIGGGYGYGYNNNMGGILGGNSGYGYGYDGGMGGRISNDIGESTRATFQLIESIIGTVTGFAQMLESSYLATHNSFFTMVSVAEQFSYLKDSLGSFFGIFTIMKVLKKLLYFITKGKLGNSITKNKRQRSLLDEFNKFADGNDDHQVRGANGQFEQTKKRGRKISMKPLIIFLMGVFGFPFLLNKFIENVNKNNSRRLSGGRGRYGNLRGQGGREDDEEGYEDGSGMSIDPNNLEFARAKYKFVPENPEMELQLSKGDLMAIISKQDPLGRDSEWWKVRTKNGDMGYVPYNYLEIIKRVAKDRRPIEDV
ncbi:peroxin PEX13 NDAI_0E04390 [Naumovozyma dairenensis CBS 421]|uniref:Peroxisomal membrane protein PEX13 n=1 Tax=Naumovozyma dairenensis (strain ATCC 10597 / BCRC 20456 / CBS 421 / NBRC 0211 / NRRL Y-12639) TaxID=1071378 RepID=G0WBY6_NAUDC|nr:hypothetical protein NDAI_0E04390 [Naumovozyma dairenensis CBS 421]CCD25256.1 hypothetical protein NDAI_0E04390 [Naumovozyma dairenensis CBS 421]